MHEVTFAKDILEKADEQGNVKSITVEVGDLAHVPAEDLEKTLKEMAKYKVNVVKKKAKVRCSCSYKGEPKIVEKTHSLTLFVCPECGNIPEILDGKDIKLIQVDVL